MAARPQTGGGEGLSVQTLLIAALASGGAAVIVSQFWEAGTVMAAAITPVIVSLLREAVLPKAIDRPARALSEVRAVRRTTDVPAVGAWAGSPAAGAGSAESRSGGAGVTTPESQPATERLTAGEPGLEDLDAETGRLEDEASFERETEPLDPATRRVDGQMFPPEGETEPPGGSPPPVGEGLPPRSAPTERPPRAADLGRNGRSAATGPVPPPSPARRRVYGASRRPPIRLAVITGLLAFVIAAVVLTVPELIAGGSVGGGSGRTTLFSGAGGEDSRQGDGAEDSVIDGGGAESPGGEGDGDGGGEDPEPIPGGGDGSSDPEEPSGEEPRQNRRSIERPDQSDQPQGGGSGASRSQGQRAPAQRAAPTSPSGGGASP